MVASVQQRKNRTSLWRAMRIITGESKVSCSLTDNIIEDFFSNRLKLNQNLRLKKFSFHQQQLVKLRK